MGHELLPLDMLAAGEEADVADVSGDPAWVHRLAELGIQAGCRLRMLRSGSPCLLQVGGCQLCLRGDATSCILVRPCGLGSIA